jgi:hypothetical protein
MIYQIFWGHVNYALGQKKQKVQSTFPIAQYRIVSTFQYDAIVYLQKNKYK